ncbi:hypothetical protein BURK1_02371 [Burkholderiales bacterium]|nr:hypothetical protein BURK1_02371 [Burkholderiales bacterium]
MPARLVAALALALVAGASHAQVFKCVDGAGRTTYQQEPCGKDAKGARVEIDPDNGATQEAPAQQAKWVAAAKVGQVLPGMPKRYVRDAYGMPTEIRGGSAVERVSEVWVYRNPGGTRRIGLLDGRVTWERGDDASSAPPTPDEAGDTASRRDGGRTAVLHAVAAGQDCGAVLAEAGRPDRSEGVQLSVAGPGGQPRLAPAMRHAYDDDGGTPPRSVAFTCLDAIVTGVEVRAR